MEDKLINDVLNYIEKELYNNPNVDEIARHFYFNRFHIMRLFKKSTGLTITEYINERKIIKSIKQLVSSDDRILKVALDNGYHSLEYYSEVFLKVTGLSPLQFRNNSLDLPLLIEEDNLLESLKLNTQLLGALKKAHNNLKTKSLSDHRVLQKKK